MNLTVRMLLLVSVVSLFSAPAIGLSAEVDDVRLLREFGKGEVITAAVQYQGRAYFLVNSGNARTLSLWQTDGTPEHTALVLRIEGETGREDNILTNSYAADLPPDERDAPLLLNGRFCFLTTEAATGNEYLWCSDGTSAGTARVAAVPQGCRGSNDAVMMGDSLVVLNKECLWRSDGTQAGTEKVSSAFYRAPFLNNNPPLLYNNRLYFSAADLHAQELWVSDGTTAGTKIFRDINTIPDSNCWVFSPADDQALPLSFCSSSSDPSNLFVFNNQLFFTAFHPVYGEVLWKTNGTTVQPFKNVLPDRDSGAYSFNVLNGRILFAAHDWTHGKELWVSDGTASGTRLLKDTLPGPEDGVGTLLGQVGNSLLFEGRDNERRSSLWKSDGSAAGTVMVKSDKAFFGGMSPSPFRKGGGDNFVYFLDGSRFWATDGTLAGTKVVIDSLHHTWNPWNPPPGGNSAVFNNTLYLAAGDAGSIIGQDDIELWAVKGSEGHHVKDLLPANEKGEYGSRPRWFLPLPQSLVFFARSSSYPDGTSLLFREGLFVLTPRQVTLPWLKPLLLNGH